MLTNRIINMHLMWSYEQIKYPSSGDHIKDDVPYKWFWKQFERICCKYSTYNHNSLQRISITHSTLIQFKSNYLQVILTTNVPPPKISNIIILFLIIIIVSDLPNRPPTTNSGLPCLIPAIAAKMSGDPLPNAT